MHLGRFMQISLTQISSRTRQEITKSEAKSFWISFFCIILWSYFVLEKLNCTTLKDSLSKFFFRKWIWNFYFRLNMAVADRTMNWWVKLIFDWDSLRNIFSQTGVRLKNRTLRTVDIQWHPLFDIIIESLISHWFIAGRLKRTNKSYTNFKDTYATS